MIDPTLPMELDDGTPVVLLLPSDVQADTNILVKFDKPPTREGRTPKYASWGRRNEYWSYRLRDGIFDGGNANDQFTLRNCDVKPEEYEDWFV